MSDLPSGAITFLFTDIEGSTQLLKQLRERYPGVLAEHQRLLRAAFAAHGGREVDTQGDAFFVAFTSAREALLAAVEGQLALLSHAWPEGVEVKVRMGLHTGQAVAADGRYSGLAVHRAARIGAAGHGGQVLVSQATQTLLEDEEEDLHIFFRDLGEQRLKDLDRPVHLYQAAADGLPASFPPLRGEAELPTTAEAALKAPWWRRPATLLAAGVAVAVLAAVVVLLATRGSSGGPSEVSANHLGVIDPGTNEIVSEVPVGIRPGPVAAGAGSVWVGNLEDRTLTRVDPAQRAASATISLDRRSPTGIAAGEGSVWVAHGRLGQLSRVDPQFDQLAETIDVAGSAADVGALGGDVAVGSGSVWTSFGESTVARVDPARPAVVASTSAGAVPAGLVLARGSLWVANAGDATVTRFDPATLEDGALRSVSVGNRPSGIAYGADAIWVANAGDGTVTRIDPSTYATTTIPVGSEPVAVAVGEGAVWVANRADATVSRIDPGSNEVVETIELENPPAGIAVADGLVWVAVEAP
jgi:YVTN family beta-propeller protein